MDQDKFSRQRAALAKWSLETAPDFLYHGTCDVNWKQSRPHTDLYVTKDFEAARQYAEEWSDDGKVPMVLAIPIRHLSTLPGVILKPNQENVEQFADGLWQEEGSGLRVEDVEWFDTYDWSRTFCIEGITQDHKQLCLVVTGPQDFSFDQNQQIQSRPERKTLLDEAGAPLLVYHGAAEVREEFAPKTGSRFTLGREYKVPSLASFFTPDIGYAQQFGNEITSANLMFSKLLDLRNGAIFVDDREAFKILKDHFGENVSVYPTEELWDILDHPARFAQLKALGYDGVAFLEPGKDGRCHDTYAIFHSDQFRPAQASPSNNVVSPNGSATVSTPANTVAYHGTGQAFSKFAQKGGLGGAVGHWLASTYDAAVRFSTPRMAGDVPRVITASFTLNNPAVFEGHGKFQEAVGDCTGRSHEDKVRSLRRKLIRGGHDGIVIHNSTTDNAGIRDDYVVFDPKAITILQNEPVADAGVSKGSADQPGPFIAEKNGEPKSFFHGTRHVFDEFDTRAVYEVDRKRLGAYFTDNARFAATYGDRVIEVHLAITNPLDIAGLSATEIIDMLPVSDFLARELRTAFRGQDYSQYALIESAQREDLRLKLESLGYDGVRYTEGYSDAYIAFHPHQIHHVGGHQPAATKGATASPLGYAQHQLTTDPERLADAIHTQCCSKSLLEEAVASGVDIEAPALNGASCLGLAIRSGQKEILHTLFSKNLDRGLLSRAEVLAEESGRDDVRTLIAGYKARALIAEQNDKRVSVKPR